MIECYNGRYCWNSVPGKFRQLEPSKSKSGDVATSQDETSDDIHSIRRDLLELRSQLMQIQLDVTQMKQQQNFLYSMINQQNQSMAAAFKSLREHIDSLAASAQQDGH